MSLYKLANWVVTENDLFDLATYWATSFFCDPKKVLKWGCIKQLKMRCSLVYLATTVEAPQ